MPVTTRTLSDDADATVFEDTTTDAAGVVVAVGRRSVPKPGSIVFNADTLRARADSSIDGLRLIKNSAGALTLLQLSNAVRLLAAVQLATLRLQLARFDDTDG